MPRVIQKQWQKSSNYAKESVLESVNPMKFFDLNGCHLKSYLLKFFEKDEVRYDWPFIPYTVILIQTSNMILSQL